jgi:Bacterial EndoU nuclease
MAVDLSRGALAAAAGADPWALAEQVATGDPDGLQAGAVRIRRAGQLAAEAAEAGRRADLTVAGSFRNDGAAVFDAPSSTRRGRRLLADGGEHTEDVARVVLVAADALAEARRQTIARLGGLDAELAWVAGQVTAAGPGTPAAVAELEQRYARVAAAAVGQAATGVQSDLDAYSAALTSLTARLDGLSRPGPGRDAPVEAAQAAVVLPRPGPPIVVIATVLAYLIGLIVKAVSDSGPEPQPPGPEPAAQPQPGDVDRNGTWERVVGAHPEPGSIHIPLSRRIHILYGDGEGGGHVHDSGVPGKTTFPEDWSEDRIIDTIEDLARSPDQAPTQRPNGRWEVTGTRDGVEIKVVIDPAGEVITGHPERGPGVHINDENGDPQPLEN